MEKTIPNKEKFVALINMTKREGAEKLIADISNGSFFEAPASTRFHGSYEGGLVAHLLSVYDTFSKMLIKAGKQEVIPTDSKIIISLLHDQCKDGMYNKTPNGYAWNRNHRPGHAKLSIARIKTYIKLTKLEEDMIKYHMGYYGSVEFGGDKGEYTLAELTQATNINPLIKMFHWADDFSSQFFEK